jgi:3-oxoacyl-[acyl-carrier protein] reductase
VFAFFLLHLTFAMSGSNPVPGLPTEPVALITGARKGIGRFLAEHLLRRHYRVIGCSRQSSDLSTKGYEHVLADVTSEAQVIGLVKHVRDQYGRLDVVINNAGIGVMNPVLLMPYSSAQAIFQTNFFGTMLVCRESIKLMMKHRWGRIVNFSTVAVPLDLEGEAVYAASKSAVETLTRILAREVGSYGVTVNAVGPSPVETDLIRQVPKAKLDALVERLSIKRVGAFDDVANIVDFFLRRESDYITGQVLYLGGA